MFSFHHAQHLKNYFQVKLKPFVIYLVTIAECDHFLNERAEIMRRTHHQETSSITEKVTENNVTQKYIAELCQKYIAEYIAENILQYGVQVGNLIKLNILSKMLCIIYHLNLNQSIKNYHVKSSSIEI